MKVLLQKARVRWMLANDEGATAVEYGILVALIAVVIITAVGLLGGQLNTVYTDVCSSIKGSAC
mgnify:CR=1 FL=1